MKTLSAYTPTMSYLAHYPSPLGLIEIKADTDHITDLNFVEKPDSPLFMAPPTNLTSQTNLSIPDHPVLAEVVRQLQQYFQGQRADFDLPLKPHGTPFQQNVWQTLLTIPFGQTLSYLDIARALNNEKAIRAVGQANGRNPISIIVPCHRVIGHNGKLTGYGGGLWRKKWLLTHEGVTMK